MRRMPVSFSVIAAVLGVVILTCASIFKAGNAVAAIGVGLLLVALIWTMIARRRKGGIGGDRDRPAFFSSRWFDDDRQDDDHDDKTHHHGHHPH